MELGRLRLVIYTIKGHEAWVWRSKIASRGPGDSDARGLWSRNQMTRTSLLWQRSVRKLPRIVVAKVLRKDGQWRAWILRQEAIIVQIDRELLEVVVIISILA